MTKKLLYIFTRTPLHVGAGSSVGAIDQPIQRERHTGFPIIPASSLKGTFADAWPAEFDQDGKKNMRLAVKKRNGSGEYEPAEDLVPEGAWLFGSNNDRLAFAGALQFSEARLLAFPIRSAKGCFAWITSPLILRRALRDAALPGMTSADLNLPDLQDAQACFDNGKESKLAIAGEIVLEEYTFSHAAEIPPKLTATLTGLLDDEVWKNVAHRLVIVSDGMMSFFSRNACEIAQHVRISDETGTAEGGALFNQENVPSETLFYSLVHFLKERAPAKNGSARRPEEATAAFGQKVKEAGGIFQFGGDASTGLGYCTVEIGGEHAKP